MAESATEKAVHRQLDSVFHCHLHFGSLGFLLLLLTGHLEGPCDLLNTTPNLSCDVSVYIHMYIYHDSEIDWIGWIA